VTLLISLSYCEYVPSSAITNIPFYHKKKFPNENDDRLNGFGNNLSGPLQTRLLNEDDSLRNPLFMFRRAPWW
jgi:hypothetical protein